MCQLNSSHICPYFLHLLDTFTEKIKKKETERTMFAKKKFAKAHSSASFAASGRISYHVRKKTNVGFRVHH